MELIIDNRERDLIKWLKIIMIKLMKLKYNLVKKNDLGDIIFKKMVKSLF